MIGHKELRDILLNIFGVPENHLVALSESMFIPTIDREDKVGDWIGYRILEEDRISRAYSNAEYYEVPLKIKFRLVFIGPNAEALCHDCLLWDDRYDVQQAFAKHEAQLFYSDRNYYTYPVKNEGFNDSSAWVVDFLAQTIYRVRTNYKPWLDGIIRT